MRIGPWSNAPVASFGPEVCLALPVPFGDVPARWTMDKGGVAVGLATISMVLAAVLFSAEHVRTGPMDFIERYLNISPDSGDGSMEILLLVALVAIVVLGASRLATK
jgi:hypothetical protein